MTTVWLDHAWAASTRGGLALLLAWAFSLLPRVPAAVRCWAWRAAHAVLIAAFIWTTPVDVSLRRPGAELPIQAEAVRPRTVVLPTVQTPPLSSASRPRLAQPAPIPIAPTILFATYLAFLAAYTLRLATAYRRARRLRHGSPINVPALPDLARTLGVAPPPVRVHPAARSPLLVGLIRPLIVLPDPPPSPADLPLVLAHELAHLKRHDLLWNWLPTVALALLPLHPLVWVGHRRWRLAAESAADAEALAATSADPAAYGRLIVTVATRPHTGVLALAAAAESRWILKQRLSAMANVTRWNRRRLVTVGVIVTVVAAATAVPWRVVAQPPATSPSTRGSTLSFQDGKVVVVDPAGDTLQADSITLTAPAAERQAEGTVFTQQIKIRSLASGTPIAVTMLAGQLVHRGDVLVQYESRGETEGVDSARQIVKASETRAAEARRVADAGWFKDDVVPALLALDNAKEVLRQRQASLEQTRVVAPVDGIIVAPLARVGQAVVTGEDVATLKRTDELALQFIVPAADAPAMVAGTPISVRAADAKPGDADGRGVVTGPAGSLDKEGRSILMSGLVTQNAEHFEDNQPVVVRFTTVAPAVGRAPTPDPFPFAVPFELGASKFLPGDRITITDVHGTAADMAGGIYRVTGTYTLASHDTATLAASVTARDAANGKGPWNAAQQLTVRKGTGTFTLMLPISIRGYPHVSFYSLDDAFSGTYFGTGDSVLRKWNGE